jgi:hypothetical protein
MPPFGRANLYRPFAASSDVTGLHFDDYQIIRSQARGRVAGVTSAPKVYLLDAMALDCGQTV